jgi:tetratricopeptide (TPR) repeat protein
MNKIAGCLILKDDSEVDILRRAISTIYKHVDAIFITGTKEPQVKIKKLCKEFNVKWSWFPWVKDFSAARNFNFSQATKEYQWIFWMDSDDIVVGAETFRQAVDLAEKNNIKAVFARYLYQVELDEKGNVKNILIEHLRERLIRNDGTFEWVAPIHETLIEKVPSGKTDFQGFTVIHLITDAEMYNSMYRNIEILEEEVIRNPQDPRPIYYLAKAYFDTRAPEILYDSVGPGLDSITVELIKDYITKSGWAEERAQAWEYLSMIYRERQQFKEAINCLLYALYEDPKFTSIYIQLALCYVVIKDWDKAFHWIKLAGNVEIPKTTLVINPRDYKSMMLEALFHIYLNTGKLEECQKVARGLLEILPTDLNKQRMKEIDDLKHKNDMAHWTIKLAYHLKETGQTEQLVNLINAIPREIANEPVLVNLRNECVPPRKWEEDEVVIYCGPGFEKWSPVNLNQGIGGSEEAVIYLSRELVKLGWKVTVFADPQNEAGIYDGVTYIPHYFINWKDEFNIFVSWRQIGVADITGLKAEKLYLWNHDIQNPLTYTPERVNKINKVMFLSKWHRDNVPDLDESKVMYTANGINI